MNEWNDYRNYRTAMALSLMAWMTALFCSMPLYFYADEASSLFSSHVKHNAQIALSSIVGRYELCSTPVAKFHSQSLVPILKIQEFFKFGVPRPKVAHSFSFDRTALENVGNSKLK